MHSTRIVLDRRVDKFSGASEFNNLVKLAIDFGASHAENRTIEISVLSASQFQVESGTYLKQCSYATMNLGVPSGRLGNARQNLQ